MTKINKEIASILREAEERLQALIARAANKAEYAAVDEARLVAVSVHNLLGKLSSAQTQKQHNKKIKLSDYPRFEVRNNKLIRTGWSKKQELEYTHTLPKRVFDTTVQVMSVLAQSATGPIPAETIINRVSDVEPRTIPSYQIYVVMGLLKNKDYIKPIGREGYEIQADIHTKAEKEWRNLAGKNYRD